MLDTIRFEIDLQNENEIVFMSLMRGSKVTVGGMRFVESGNFLTETKTKEYIKAKVTSASYDINYQIFPLQMKCTFEFSIPKYLYGHNLFHCCDYMSDISKFLREFIFTFFQNEFGFEPKLSTITLLRIDLCLNLYFETPEQKEDFMAVSESIFSDEFAEGKLMRYDGTTFYKLREYSFKIYDKGKEFVKNDYKKLVKIKGTKQAALLGDLSQRIARCELTLRKEKISYLFFDNLGSCSNQSLYSFRKAFANLREHYNRVNGALTNICRWFNKYLYKEIDEEAKELIRQKIKENIISEFVFTDPGPLLDAYLMMKAKRNTPFTPSEFSYVVDKMAAAKMQTYNSYRSPKPILLETTKQQKQYNKAVRPEVLEFDSQIAHQCFRMFDEVIFKIVKNCSVSDKPLDVLRAMQKQNPGDRKLKSVYKYFALAERHSDKALIKRQLISRETIRTIKKVYLPDINKRLSEAGLPEIGKFKIKAWPATEIDRSIYL